MSSQEREDCFDDYVPETPFEDVDIAAAISSDEDVNTVTDTLAWNKMHAFPPVTMDRRRKADDEEDQPKKKRRRPLPTIDEADEDVDIYSKPLTPTGVSHTVRVSSPEPDPVPAPAPVPPPSPPRPVKFQIKAKAIFCTWPQNEDAPGIILARAVKLWPSCIDYAVACIEDHKDTMGKHNHAVFRFTTRKTITGYDVLDKIGGKHGNYRACRDVKASIIYCKKDGVFEEINAEGAPKPEKQKVTDAVATMIMKDDDGKALVKVNERFPGFMLLHKSKIQDYASWLDFEKAKDALPVKKPWLPIPYDPLNFDPAGINDNQWCQAAEWCNTNLDGTVRKHRQKQLYLWGETGLGKTMFINWLEQYFKIYRMPHSKWMEGYNEKEYNICVCDEFNGCYPIGFINEARFTQFVQGTTMWLEVKGAMKIKTKNLPVIFLSNKSLSSCYPDIKDAYTKAALMDRFVEVQVTQRCPYFVL